MAVMVKCWSKAKVEVEVLYSGTGGLLRGNVTAALSMVHCRRLSVWAFSEVVAAAEEVVFLSRNPTRTPLRELINTLFQLTYLYKQTLTVVLDVSLLCLYLK